MNADKDKNRDGNKNLATDESALSNLTSHFPPPPRRRKSIPFETSATTTTTLSGPGSEPASKQ